MLIGFSGPSGSGKTTLVNKLAKKLSEEGYRVSVVKEVAREVFECYRDLYGFKGLNDLRNSHALLAFQDDVLFNQIYREDKGLEEADIVLADRTIYDNLFFTIPAIYRCNDYSKLDDYIRKFKEAEIRNGLRYDVIFFCRPLNGVDIDDGFRTYDIRYRTFQEFIIWRLIPNKARVFVLPQAGLDERLRVCLEVVKGVWYL